MSKNRINPDTGTGDVPAKSKVSLTELLAGFSEYLQTEDFSDRTIESYTGCVSRYLKWCQESYGDVTDQLYRENILDFKSYMVNIAKYLPPTINQYICSLVCFNDYLVKIRHQAEMAVRGKDRIKIQTDQTNPNDLESADIERFRQQILEGQGTRDHTIVTVMAYGGLRVSEVISIFEHDINFQSGELLVRSGKGDKSRVVYINDRIINAVREYIKERQSDSPYLFVSRQGDKLVRSRINQIFNQYSDMMTPHKCRHFYCSQAQNVAGYSIAETAQQAGHASPRTTLRYSHPSKKDIINKANKL